MTDIGTVMTRGKEEQGMVCAQLHQGCSFALPPEYSNNEFLSKEQQRAQFDADARNKFMRDLG